MIEWLGELNALHWFAIAGILLILELMTGTMYLLFIGSAAVLVALKNAVWPGSWESDLVLFSILATLLTVLGHFFVKPRIRTHAAVGLNEPAHALVGRRALALADFKIGEGRVKMGDTEWRARTDDHIQAGEDLVVVGVDGATLLVETLPE